MDLTDIGLFRLAEKRLAWVDQRQQLLAQNIANANTPSFQPRDVPSFAGHVATATLVQTSPLHMTAAGQALQSKQGKMIDRAPNGNGISMEAELGKVADTASVQQLVLNLEHSYLGMFRTIIGRAG